MGINAVFHPVDLPDIFHGNDFRVRGTVAVDVGFHLRFWWVVTVISYRD